MFMYDAGFVSPPLSRILGVQGSLCMAQLWRARSEVSLGLTDLRVMAIGMVSILAWASSLLTQGRPSLLPSASDTAQSCQPAHHCQPSPFPRHTDAPSSLPVPHLSRGDV